MYIYIYIYIYIYAAWRSGLDDAACLAVRISYCTPARPASSSMVDLQRKVLSGLSQNEDFRKHSRRKQKKAKLGWNKQVSVSSGFNPLQSNPLKPFSQILGFLLLSKYEQILHTPNLPTQITPARIR